MPKKKGFLHLKTTLALLLVSAVCATAVARPEWPGWNRKEVDWRLTGGSRIKAIHYPKDKPLPQYSTRADRPRKKPRKKTITKEAGSQPTPLATETATSIIANVINSPPIDGFVPWVAVGITDARSTDDDAYAYDIDYTVGYFLTPTPQVDYAIGLYDTGASTSIMGYADAYRAGVFAKNLDGPATVELIGATGSVEAIVSYPLGLFIDSISVIKPYPYDPNGTIEIDDLVDMVGEYNTSILLGQPPLPGAPDLPTAIGSPMSVFYAAHFQVDQPITITHNSQDFTGPNTTFLPWYDSGIPTYSNKITLEVRPDGDYVAYYLWIDIYTLEFYPLYPSMIMGQLGMQSLFFFPEVDLKKGNNSAPAQDEFMFDTGAQVTVVGSILAARLALNNPDFYVEIIDVTGESTIVDGFFIDSIEIPAIGEWLSFTNVPVIVLDIDSPEGGYLDGIIGMNLFTEYNFVLNGGGMSSPPYIEFEQIPYHIPADIAPPGGDDKVDHLDLADFAKAYLATPTSTNWNSKADMVSDAEINLYDFAILGKYWGQEITP